MELILRRAEYRQDGIFGELSDEDDERVCITLEHAYLTSDRNWKPKIPPGIYFCGRGRHTLFGVPDSFETFEVLGVDGHTGLLFHPGNYNNDSHGCILVGTKIRKLGFGVEMIAESKVAFRLFMELQKGLDSFKLTIFA